MTEEICYTSIGSLQRAVVTDRVGEKYTTVVCNTAKSGRPLDSRIVPIVSVTVTQALAVHRAEVDRLKAVLASKMA